MKIAIAVVAVILVIIIVENLRISVSRYRVTCRGLSKNFKGFRIVHLSDLHSKRFGKNYGRLTELIIPLHPDLIFFTGDLISRNEHDISKKISLMESLMKIAPVYYSIGNHETDNQETTARLIKAIKKLGVTVLINSKATIERNNDRIDIYGLALERYFYVDTNDKFVNLPPVMNADVNELLGKNNGGNFSILLTHTPLPFEEYEKWGADLIFAGHMHGGVVRIPFTHKGMLSPERKFFPEYTEGVFRKFGANMIVSRGLGKFRLFNPSEIVLVSLR